MQETEKSTKNDYFTSIQIADIELKKKHIIIDNFALIFRRTCWQIKTSVEAKGT